MVSCLYSVHVGCLRVSPSVFSFLFRIDDFDYCQACHIYKAVLNRRKSVWRVDGSRTLLLPEDPPSVHKGLFVWQQPAAAAAAAAAAAPGGPRDASAADADSTSASCSAGPSSSSSSSSEGPTGLWGALRADALRPLPPPDERVEELVASRLQGGPEGAAAAGVLLCLPSSLVSPQPPKGNPAVIQAIEAPASLPPLSRQQLTRLNCTRFFPLYHKDAETLRVEGLRSPNANFLTLILISDENVWPLVIQARFQDTPSNSSSSSSSGGGGGRSLGVEDGQLFASADSLLVSSYVRGHWRGSAKTERARRSPSPLRGAAAAAAAHQASLDPDSSSSSSSMEEGRWYVDIHRVAGPGGGTLRFKGTICVNGEVHYWRLVSPVAAANPPRFVAVGGAAAGRKDMAVYFSSHLNRHLELLLPHTLQQLHKFIFADPNDCVSPVPPPHASCTAPATAAAAAAADQQQQHEQEVLRLCTEATRSALQQQPLLQVQLPVDTQQRQALTAAVRCFQWEAATQAQNLLLQLLLQQPRAALPLWPQLLRTFADLVRARPSLRGVVAELLVRVLRAADAAEQLPPPLHQQQQQQKQELLLLQQQARFWAVVPRSLPGVRLGAELLIQLRSLCLLGLMSVGLLDLHFNSEFGAFRELVEARERQEGVDEAATAAAADADAGADAAAAETIAAAGDEAEEETAELTAPEAARSVLRQVASELLHPPPRSPPRPLVLSQTVNGRSTGQQQLLRRCAASTPPLVGVDPVRLSRQGFLNPALLLHELGRETRHPYSPVAAFTATAEASVPYNWATAGGKQQQQEQEQQQEQQQLQHENATYSTVLRPEDASSSTSDNTNSSSSSSSEEGAFCLGESPLCGGELSPGFAWARGCVLRFCRLSGTRLGDALRFYSQGEAACVAAYR